MANDTLYKDLASVYEAMYYTFIDYEEQFNFYNAIRVKYYKKSILEMACGSGSLAQHFLKANIDYTGLDLSQEMIDIAKTKPLKGSYEVGDIPSFTLANPVDSVLIAGRSMSYLIDNKDVLDTFSSISHNLQAEGILMFDFIDANLFIPPIIYGEYFSHEALYIDRHFVRDSYWIADLENAMNFKWDAEYFEVLRGAKKSIGKDQSIVRSFTLNEIELFLSVRDFNLLEVIPKSSYAFPTMVIVAQKK